MQFGSATDTTTSLQTSPAQINGTLNRTHTVANSAYNMWHKTVLTNGRNLKPRQNVSNVTSLYHKAVSINFTDLFWRSHRSVS